MTWSTAPYHFTPLVASKSHLDLAGELGDLTVTHDRRVPGTYSGHLDVTIDTLTPLYVGRGGDGEATADARSLTWPGCDELAWIPGASVRGALRDALAAVLGDPIIVDAHGDRVVTRQPIGKLDAPDIQARSTAYWTSLGIEGPNAQRTGLLYLDGDVLMVQPTGPRVRVAWSRLWWVQGVADGAARGAMLDQMRLHTLEHQFAPVVLEKDLPHEHPGRPDAPEPGAVRPPRGDERHTHYLLITGAVGIPGGKQVHGYAIPVAPAGEPIPCEGPAKELLFAWDTHGSEYQSGKGNNPQDHGMVGDPMSLLREGRKLPVFYAAARGAVHQVGFSGGPRTLGFSPREILAAQGAEHVQHPPRDQMSALSALFGAVVETQDSMDGESYEVAGRVSVGEFTARIDPGSDFLGERQLSVLSPKIQADHLRLGVDGEGNPGYYFRNADGTGLPRFRGRERYLHRWRVSDTRLATWDVVCNEHAPPEDKMGEGEGNTLVPFRPLREGATFVGRIHFHNLSPLELGALLFAVWLGNDPGDQRGEQHVQEWPQYAHKIGGLRQVGLGSAYLSAEVLLDAEPGAEAPRTWADFAGGGRALDAASQLTLINEFIHELRESRNNHRNVPRVSRLLMLARWAQQPPRSWTAEMPTALHAQRRPLWTWNQLNHDLHLPTNELSAESPRFAEFP